MCTHSMEFDRFYRAGIYGRPCNVEQVCDMILCFKKKRAVYWNYYFASTPLPKGNVSCWTTVHWLVVVLFWHVPSLVVK